MAQPALTSKRVLVTAAYEPNGQGVLLPVLPPRCAFAVEREVCHLFVDHFRVRKTGPCFPLAVVACSGHPGRRYTLYPPGHFPYGREPVAPVSTTGSLFCELKTGIPTWAETYFAAAIDAAQGERWSCGSPFDDPRRRRTQGRRLERSGHLLGVHPALEPDVCERIASRLGVPVMKLQAARRRWGDSWTARGLAVTSVLEEIVATAAVALQILAAGAAGALWAEPGAG